MRRSLAFLVLGVAFAIWAWAALAPSGGACVLTATYLDAPFVDAGSLPAAEVAEPVGPGTLPACDDTPGGGPVEVPTTITLHRVRGVAPRLGVALPSADGRSSLLVLAESPCVTRPADHALACLRRATRALVEGPSLIAPPSARAGEVIEVVLHVRSPRLRKLTNHGLDTLLQGRVEGRWRSLFHMHHPLPGFEMRVPDPTPVGPPHLVLLIGLGPGHPFALRLPHVEPGIYRLAKRVGVRGPKATRHRWVFSLIAIRPPAAPESVQAAERASTT